MTPPDANIRSSSYYIVQTTAQCPHCGQWTRVLALAVPPNHEILNEDEWQTVDANAFIFHLTELPQVVERQLRQISSVFRLARSTDASNPQWANHCERCNLILSDEQLHCEPGGFMPGQVDEAQRISLLAVPQAFSAVAAGFALDPQFFMFMRRR
jgi:hypothetical protein